MSQPIHKSEVNRTRINRKKRRSLSLEAALAEQEKLTRRDVIDKYSVAVAMTVRDHLGYGKQRVQKFMTALDDKFDSLLNDYATFEDFRAVLAEEMDIHIKTK